MTDNSVKICVKNGCETTKPCFSNTTISTCPLLDIEAQEACIDDVCQLSVAPLSQSTTTDSCYVFQVLERCRTMETCLKGWFGPQISSRITNKPSLTYKGNVTTNRIIIDLDCCALDFDGLAITCGQQTIVL